MAFGKRSSVSGNLNDFSIMICGESGIGKTTVMARMAEKEFGEDGYLLLNTGDEEGVSAIDGVTYEDVPTYKKYVDVCNDIIKNKDTEYPNLKVIIVDTLDQLIEPTEKYAVEEWNRSNMSVKNFKPAKSLNGVEGGFGAGYDVVFDLIYSKVRALDKVGVKTWYVCHSKTKDIIDPLTSSSYTTLTSNMAQRYFNDFKTKAHIVGVACIDRTIEAVDTGRKDIKNKEITINKIKGENRQIVFRDDSYSVDAKSRFENIVDRIPLDADELLKALKDAIKSSQTSVSKNSKTKPSETITNTKSVENDDFLDIEGVSDDSKYEGVAYEETTSQYPDNLSDTIRTMFAECEDSVLKAKVKKIIVPYGKLKDVDEDGLKQIYDILR